MSPVLRTRQEYPSDVEISARTARGMALKSPLHSLQLMQHALRAFPEYCQYV